VIEETEGYEDATYDGKDNNISINASHDLDYDYDLEYQWYKGSVSEANKINGATYYYYTVKNVSDSGTYGSLSSIGV